MSQTARISRTDGAQIAAEFQGDANRPALLLSNSLATTRALWDPLMPALLNAFCVVRYDTRGHGESTTPNDHATLEDLADDAVAVLDHFQIQKALMVGISLGGMTALSLALSHPSRLTGTLACNCRSGVDDAGRAAWAQRVDIALTQGMGELIQPTIERWFPQDFRDAHRGVMATVADMIQATDPKGFAACVQAITGSTLDSNLSQITVPTRFVAGDSDGAAPPDLMAAMAARVQGASCTTLAACGHLSSINQSEGLLTEINELATTISSR